MHSLRAKVPWRRVDEKKARSSRKARASTVLLISSSTPSSRSVSAGLTRKQTIPQGRGIDDLQVRTRADVALGPGRKLHPPGDGDSNRHAFYDVGQAVAQMALQALDLGLYMHQMAGFDVEKAQQVFGIPAQFEPAAAIALGYLGDPADLPERYREGEARPRSRKPLADFVFAGQWGQASPLAVEE